jgi:uroporphyrin-III C-methyltransferase
VKTGKVFLVGAGPGDPELLTLKAAKLLRAADVVLHDELVSPEILALVPATATVFNVGKRCGKLRTSQDEIHRLLAEHASLGLNVVRLKGGDPMVFGRGGEELEYLRRLNISLEVVPGVTAAVGAAAALQVPLTHRDVSSTLILLTGTGKDRGHSENWPEKIPPQATVVIYMPGHDFDPLINRLIRSGVGGETPCAIISGASTEGERVHVTTVEHLRTAPPLPAPKLLVIGEVVRWREVRGLREQFSGFRFSENQEVSPNFLESAE